MGKIINNIFFRVILLLVVIGHSRILAAMCRAVGIPPCLSTGGMYVADNGGFFGQLVWTEVYMGAAGWIPVDATIGEVDFIDAIHIRLGEKSTFHPEKMEIIDYRVVEF